MRYCIVVDHNGRIFRSGPKRTSEEDFNAIREWYHQNFMNLESLVLSDEDSEIFIPAKVLKESVITLTVDYHDEHMAVEDAKYDESSGE